MNHILRGYSPPPQVKLVLLIADLGVLEDLQDVTMTRGELAREPSFGGSHVSPPWSSA